MRRFGLVGVVLVMWTGSVSAQQVYRVTTCCQGGAKTTVIELARLPTLDELSQRPLAHGAAPCAPLCAPYPLCCLLPDQPALLTRLAVMNALHTTGLGVPIVPKLDELPRPALLDERKVEAPGGENAPVREAPAAAAMITLGATNWSCGRCFTDERGRRWCLLKGCALPNTLPRMRGWLLESDGKRLYFLSESGNIYTPMPVPPLP